MAVLLQQIHPVALPLVSGTAARDTEIVRPSHGTVPWDRNRMHLLPPSGSSLGATRTRICSLPHHTIPAFRPAPERRYCSGNSTPRDLLCLWNHPLRWTCSCERKGFPGRECLPHHHTDTVATLPILLRPPENGIDTVASCSRPSWNGFGCAIPDENTTPPAFRHNFCHVRSCFSPPERYGEEEKIAPGHHTDHQRLDRHQHPSPLRLVRGVSRLHGTYSVLLFAPSERTPNESAGHGVRF